MVKQITINISNKTFYLFVIIASVLVISGLVIAYNSDYLTNPLPTGSGATLGHSYDEIDGLTTKITDVANELISDRINCLSPTYIFNSSDIPLIGGKHIMPSNNFALGRINVPAECIGQICILKQEIYLYNNPTTPKIVKYFTYSQDSGGAWTSNTLTGLNGNSAYSSFMSSYGALYAFDDDPYARPATEIIKGNWSLIDLDATNDMKIYVC